jgi:hypothetical protein
MTQQLQDHSISPCPLCFTNFLTEATEDLCDLCVNAFPATEGTEKNFPAARNVRKTALLRKFTISVGVRLFIVSTGLLHLEGNQD